MCCVFFSDDPKIEFTLGDMIVPSTPVEMKKFYNKHIQQPGSRSVSMTENGDSLSLDK